MNGGGGGDWPTTDQDMVKIVRWLRQLTGSWTRGAKPPTVAIIGGGGGANNLSSVCEWASGSALELKYGWGYDAKFRNLLIKMHKLTTLPVEQEPHYAIWLDPQIPASQYSNLYV